MMIILIIVVYAVIALIQTPSLIKEKNWRELAIFSCFLAVAFVFSLLLSLGIKLPSPLGFIQHEIQDRFNLHY